MSMKQLTVLFNGVVQNVFLLDVPRVVIGRGTAAHIPLEDNPFVSRQHAAILFEGATHVLEDLGGPNGTFVGEKRIRLHPLAIGDRILLGKHSLRYEEATALALSLRERDTTVDEPMPGTDQEVPELAVSLQPDESGFWEEAAVDSGTIEPPKPKKRESRMPALDPNSFDDASRTVAASKNELDEMVRQMTIKEKPHLSVSREGRIELLPIDLLPFHIGWSNTCHFRLDGRKWFGKLAATIEKQHGAWYLVARSPTFSPVTVGGNRVQKKTKLTSSTMIGIGGQKFRFVSGEQG